MEFDINKLQTVGYSKVKRFANSAAKERVSMKDSKNTTWFLYDEDIAVAGVMIRQGHIYRIKGVWVNPIARGLGIGSKFTDFILTWCEATASIVEAFAHNPKFYIERGFKQKGVNQFGVPYVVKVLDPL